MRKKLQVFVSSTYIDMKDERQAAVEGILRAGHIPAGMELFASGSVSQTETIKRWIDDSDVFMLILGGRYGSIEPTLKKSYIELEYDYARDKKKPYFAAVMKDDHLNTKVKNHGLDVIERDHTELFKQFRKKVTDSICQFFDGADSLKLIVFQSLAEFAQDASLSGWIKGSEVVDPTATLKEMERLQAENAQLRQQVSTLESRVQSDGETTSKISLTEDATRLLVAMKNADGTCIYISYQGALQVGSTNLLNSDSHREQVHWDAVLNELLRYGLIESMGSDQQFQLTERGYLVVDQLESGAKADGES